MKALIIAPHVNLENSDKEVDAIINAGLPASVVRGDVTHERLVALDWGEHDIVWIASHSTEAQGIQISDGWLDIESLAPYVRESGAQLVVLNSCDSIALGQAIADECGTDVICTITQVGDLTAYRTAVRFAKRLVDNNFDFYDAYQYAKPGGKRKYLYLEPEDDGAVRGVRLPDSASLQMRIDTVFRLLAGDQYSPGGVLGDMKTMRDTIEQTRQEGQEREYRLTEAIDEMKRDTQNSIKALSDSVNSQLRREFWLFVIISAVAFLALGVVLVMLLARTPGL